MSSEIKAGAFPKCPHRKGFKCPKCYPSIRTPVRNPSDVTGEQALKLFKVACTDRSIPTRGLDRAVLTDWDIIDNEVTFTFIMNGGYRTHETEMGWKEALKILNRGLVV